MKWIRKVFSLMVLFSLLLGSVNVAHALPHSLMQQSAFDRMSQLKIANGVARADGTIDPALGEPITRAQMMAMIVRAFGAESAAVSRKGTTPFRDVPATHWASGYVAVAVDLAAKQNATIGRNPSTFDPEAQVTQAEVLAFIMKFIGIPRDAVAQWPNDYIQGAVTAGLLTPADKATFLDFPTLPAFRGMAFALADHIFYSYKGLPGNKSIYTAFVDTQGPSIAFAGVPEKTEAESLTITGTIGLDAVSFTAGGERVRVNADGSFSLTYPLAVGANTFVFKATDLAGNVTEMPLTVTRTEPPAGPKIAGLKPSKSVAAVLERITFSATDEDGNPITEGVVYTTDDEDSVILRNGVFQAVQPGRYFVKATVGKLFATTIIEVYGSAASLKIDAPPIVANGLAMKEVTVTAVDQNGTPVLNFGQNGERVSLTGTGITTYDADGILTTEVTAQDGKATFKVKLSSYLAGERITVSARHQDGNKVLTGSGTIEGTRAVASGLKVEGPTYLSANKSFVTSNAVKVWVVDQDGSPMNTSHSVAATVSGPAKLINANSIYNSDQFPAVFDLNNWDTIGLTGTIRLTFTVDGIGSATHEIQHVISGTPSQISVKPNKTTAAATESVTMTVSVEDRNGVPVSLNDVLDTQLSIVLPTEVQNKFYLPGGSTVTILRGKTSATFRLEARAAFTGDLLVTVNGPNNMTGQGTVKIVPGTVFSRSFDRPKVVMPVTAPRATLKGYVSDIYGNPVPQRDVTMRAYVQEVSSTSSFSGFDTPNVRVNGQTTTAASPALVKTDADGKVTLEVEATPYMDKVYVVVLTNANGTDAAYSHLMVVANVPTAIDVTTYKRLNLGGGEYIQTTNVTAGEQFYVKVRVKDIWAGPVTNVANELKVVTNGKIFSNGVELIESSAVTFRPFASFNSAFPEEAKMIQQMGLQPGDYVASNIYGGVAGTQPVTVKYDLSLNPIQGTGPVQVRAGEFAKVTANGGQTIRVQNMSVTGPYTLQLADYFGNPTSVTMKQDVIWQVMNGSTPVPNAVGFRETQSGANVNSLGNFGTAVFWLDVNTPGTYTINFFAGGKSGSVQLEVISN